MSEEHRAAACYPRRAMSTPPTRGKHTLQDWLALPEDANLELIDGELVPKAAPKAVHGKAQLRTAIALSQFDRRVGGPGGAGGWWFGSEVDILLDGNVFRPDLAGWRRDRVAGPPAEWPAKVRPDWLCELVSESHRTTDTVVKFRRYHQAGVPHYWIIDQVDRTLTVYRHTPEGYLVALCADAAELVRAEPFDAIELRVAVLLGDDPDE